MVYALAKINSDNVGFSPDYGYYKRKDKLPPGAITVMKVYFMILKNWEE
jgi:hypothetical protein